MPKLDIVDEAIIDAPSKVVYKAMLDEYAGLTRWWMPYLEVKPGKGSPMGGVNMAGEVIVHSPMGIKSRFALKITRVEDGKSISIDYPGGDFIGTGIYTFEPVDGKTRIRFRWIAQPNRLLLKILSPMVKRVHSSTMQNGYKSLNHYLNKK